MKIKKMMVVLFFLCAHFVHAATLVIVNQCPFPLAVQPVLNTKDEYVTQFKYSIAPGQAVTYRSGIYSIKGIRWKKSMVNRDGKSFITLDYITTDMPEVSFYNDLALIEIYANSRYEYYPNKNNVKHYIESEGYLVAANLYQKQGERFELKNTGLNFVPGEEELKDWTIVIP